MKGYFQIAFLLTLISLGACYQNKEGCLDTFAANFDASADTECPKCCVYPSLVISVTQMVGDSTYKVDSVLINDLGQKYRIVDLRFYLSTFTLYKAGPEPIKVNEYISNLDNSIYLPDDMKIFRSADKSIIPGTIKNTGTFDSISFYLGLPDTLLKTKFANLPNNHVLDTLNALTKKSSIAFFTAKILRLKNMADTTSKDSIISLSLNASGKSQKFSINKRTTIKNGSNIEYSIICDYEMLFRNLDLRKSLDSIELKLNQNISKGFIVY